MNNRLFRASGPAGDVAVIADFLIHAAHIMWPRRQTRRLIDLYCAYSGDTAIRERIPV